MKANKIKKAFCFVVILSLVAVWVRLDVCNAQERNDVSLSEELTEQNYKNAQNESKSENSVFENYVLPAVFIPLVPVFVGAQIVCMFVTKDGSRCIGH